MNRKEKKRVFMFWLLALFYFLDASYAASVRFDHSYTFFNLTSYLSFLNGVYDRLGNKEFNTSQKCQEDTRQLLNQAQNGNVEALKILDSTGKLSSGILEGGVFFIGYYSECVNNAVEVPDKPIIHGKYCLLNLNFSASEHQKAIPQVSWLVLTEGQKPPTIAICIPSSCSEDDFSLASSASLDDNFGNVHGNVQLCHRNTEGFASDFTSVMIMCFLAIFIVLSVMGTVFDCLWCNSAPPKEEAMTDVATKSVSTEALCDKDNPKSNYKNVIAQIMMAFSMKRNFLKIITVESNSESIGCLHGLRFFSMVLIIFGHTFSFSTQNIYFRNPNKAGQAPKDFISQVFANGTLCVDTFYFLSGLLLAFTTLSYLEKTDGKFSFLNFYLHRYFRLTPLMMAVILFCAFILRYIGSGPNWLSSIEMYDGWCQKNWWINALYLQNFIHTETMCLSHTWYLATDMQFYLVAPLILIPLYKNKVWGFVVLFIFLFGTILATALITFLNHYPAIPYVNHVLPMEFVNAYYKNVYIKPYCRMAPYIVGIFVGHYLLHNKEVVLKKLTATIIWIVSVITGLTVIYLMWPANQGYLPTDSEAAAYSALARFVWSICIGWLTFACVYGYGGFINKILSWPVLVPFSRLTYCAYLIHPVIMNVYFGSIENTVDFSYSFLLYTFIGNLFLTYLISLFLSLIFESPFVALIRVLTKKSS